MMRLLWAGAMALACLAAPAVTQVSPSVKAAAPAGFLPGQASFCSADAGVTWAPCSGSGGGGSSSPSAYQGETPLTVGTPATAGRALKASCTAGGNVTVTYTDGSTGVWQVAFGTQTLPLAVTTVAASGTTATCTYANIK